MTSATQSIYCTELTAAELAERVELSCDAYDPEFGNSVKIEINDEEWHATEDGKLVRSNPPQYENPSQQQLPLT